MNTSRISSYSYQPRNITFGHNKGFFEAVDNLKRRVTPTYNEKLDAHAKNLVKDDAFWKKVNQILDDDNVKPVVKKMIRWALEGK